MHRGLSGCSASDGGVYDPSTRSITWLLGSLDPNASITVSYVVTVDASGSFENAACVEAVDEFGNEAGPTCSAVTVTGGPP